MIYFLIIGVLGFIVGKFIYDSYLTDNTQNILFYLIKILKYNNHGFKKI